VIEDGLVFKHRKLSLPGHPLLRVLNKPLAYFDFRTNHAPRVENLFRSIGVFPASQASWNAGTPLDRFLTFKASSLETTIMYTIKSQLHAGQLRYHVSSTEQVLTEPRGEEIDVPQWRRAPRVFLRNSWY
jgi:hypothetical protein